MLKKIKFSYREADKQEGLFTPYHTLYKCKIKVDGLQYTFTFQCNVTHTTPNLLVCLEALLMDAYAYDECHDVVDFCQTFRYNNADGIKAYKGCKKHYKALHRLFTDEEIEQIEKELEEEGF